MSKKLAVEKRQSDLELELARARNIPVLYVGLNENPQIPLWDFQHTDELIANGYEITRRVLDEQRKATKTGVIQRIFRQLGLSSGRQD